MKSLMKEICDKHNLSLDEAKVVVVKKRKVVYILSHGDIVSSDCFHENLNNGGLPLLLIPDGFKVAFQALSKVWIGHVTYLKDNTVASSETNETENLYPFYNVIPVSKTGELQTDLQSGYCKNPTKAFKQSYCKKVGEIPNNRRPNGRLMFGLHYPNMQFKLCQTLFSNTTLSKQELESVINDDQNATGEQLESKLLMLWKHAIDEEQQKQSEISSDKLDDELSNTYDSDQGSARSIGVKRSHEIMREHSSNSLETLDDPNLSSCEFSEPTIHQYSSTESIMVPNDDGWDDTALQNISLNEISSDTANQPMEHQNQIHKNTIEGLANYTNDLVIKFGGSSYQFPTNMSNNNTSTIHHEQAQENGYRVAHPTFQEEQVQSPQMVPSLFENLNEQTEEEDPNVLLNEFL